MKILASDLASVEDGWFERVIYELLDPCMPKLSEQLRRSVINDWISVQEEMVFFNDVVCGAVIWKRYGAILKCRMPLVALTTSREVKQQQAGIMTSRLIILNTFGFGIFTGKLKNESRNGKLNRSPVFYLALELLPSWHRASNKRGNGGGETILGWIGCF